MRQATKATLGLLGITVLMVVVRFFIKHAAPEFAFIFAAVANTGIAGSAAVSAVRGVADPRRLLAVLAVGMVFLVLSFAFLHCENGLVDESQRDPVHSFEAALYFSVITTTSVGYGDLHPRAENSGRLLTALQAVLGYLYLALFVGLFIQLRRWDSREVRIERSDTELLRRVNRDFKRLGLRTASRDVPDAQAIMGRLSRNEG